MTTGHLRCIAAEKEVQNAEDVERIVRLRGTIAGFQGLTWDRNTDGLFPMRTNLGILRDIPV